MQSSSYVVMHSKPYYVTFEESTEKGVRGPEQRIVGIKSCGKVLGSCYQAVIGLTVEDG